MDIQEAFQIIVRASRAYRGTADEHEGIAKALSTIQQDLQKYEQIKHQEPGEDHEKDPDPSDD
jgi:hypothetical protein